MNAEVDWPGLAEELSDPGVMRITGATKDGQCFVAGIFFLRDSLGLPWEIIFDQLRMAKLIPDWALLFLHCARAGWSDDRIDAIKAAAKTVWGDEFERQFQATIIRG